MLFLNHKIQNLFFIFIIQAFALKFPEYESIQSVSETHFIHNFLEMSEFMGGDSNQYLEDVIIMIKDYLNQLDENIENSQNIYYDKLMLYSDHLSKLKNQSEYLDHETKLFAQQIYENQLEIDECFRELNVLNESKQQIIQMKLNESQIFHLEINEKNESLAEYEQIYFILIDCRNNLSTYLEKGDFTNGNIESLMENRKMLGKIKTKKKTIKNSKLQNLLLLNEPLIKMIIFSDLKDENIISELIQKFDEIVQNIEKDYIQLKKEISEMKKNYGERVENLYQEYETLCGEIEFVSQKLKSLEGIHYFYFYFILFFKAKTENIKNKNEVNIQKLEETNENINKIEEYLQKEEENVKEYVTKVSSEIEEVKKIQENLKLFLS